MKQSATEQPKSDKAKAKEEAKRLKLEKFQQKQAKKNEETKSKDKDKDKESSIKKLISLTSNLELEDVPKGSKKNVLSDMPQTYIPRQVEHSWYSYWETNGFFKPEYENSEAKLCGEAEKNKKFVMVMPPPNVTGTLHIGHALTIAIQDSLVRWNRMKGITTLWVPGSDHAGIATQVVVEKKIQREMNKTRHDLGREAFIEEVWKWKHEKGDFIFDQLRKLGCSVDWDRTTFTLDPHSLTAVKEAFKRLFKRDLIFRDKRLVNWSCKLNSAISDIEVIHEELSGRKTLQVPGYEKRIEFGVFETFAYEIINREGESLEPIKVSTTRLETMLGDTAIAVHPEDPRYSSYVGKFAKHPFVDRKIIIVADDKVDIETGTGAVKITPAHDFEDYEKGIRHNLEFINIFTDDGNIVDNYGKFSGMKRFDARFAIRSELKNLGLYVGEPESRAMTVPVCERSKDIVEPRLKEQWFVRCKDLATRALELSESGELSIPKSHMQRWRRWLSPNTIRDWCISRQLWWGIQIPVYKVSVESTSRSFWVAATDIDDAKKEALELLTSKELKTLNADTDLTIVQDEDVLDTWFSSSLFPFSVFHWPDSKNGDLEKFYPTELLETGEDIIFFWVARMVMLGLALTDKLPFKEVFLHSIVRDAEGRKMSKSLGNVIDPLDVISGITLLELNQKLEGSNLYHEEFSRAIEGQKKLFPNGIPECGTDALRFKLCEYCCGTGDINLRIDQLVGDRLLCNKIWQACKFTSIALGDNFKFSYKQINAFKRSEEEKKVVSQLVYAITEANVGFETMNFRRVTVACRTFWREALCSVYIEEFKKEKKDKGDVASSYKETLFMCVETGLRLLHPLMPYITEELYQRLMTKYSSDGVQASICVARYPLASAYIVE